MAVSTTSPDETRAASALAQIASTLTGTGDGLGRAIEVLERLVGGRVYVVEDLERSPRIRSRDGRDESIGLSVTLTGRHPPTVAEAQLDGRRLVAGIARGGGGRLVAVAAERPDDPPPWLEDVLLASGTMFAFAGEAALIADSARSAEAYAQANAILGASLDGVVTIDRAGRIVEINPSAQEIFGLAREEVVGREMADLIVPPELRDAHRAGLARHIETGEGPALNRRLELPALRADGSRIVIELVIAPIEVGSRTLYSGFVRDVTEDRRRAQELRTATGRLEALIANLGAGILVEDEARRIVLVNREFLQIFGIPAEPAQMVGLDCAAAAEESARAFADPTGFLAGIRRLLATRRVRLGEELPFEDGRVLERDYVPIFVGDDYRGHLWVYRDVTSRKVDERRRERLLLAEREARERLEQHNRELEDLDRLRSELVATVSHELRTPLTSIVSLSGLLADPDDGHLDKEQRDYVEVIERNAERLLRVIDDLLLLARLETGKIELSFGEVDVHELVTHAAIAFRPTTETKGLRLEVHADDGPAMVGDGARLGQALDNLLSNSVKFTPEGGVIELHAAFTDETWTITVADTGVGVPADELPKLFQRFYRARGHQGVAGTGLGLAVVGAIVDVHDGHVRMESTDGRGATVTIRLPLGQVGGRA